MSRAPASQLEPYLLRRSSRVNRRHLHFVAAVDGRQAPETKSVDETGSRGGYRIVATGPENGAAESPATESNRWPRTSLDSLGAAGTRCLFRVASQTDADLVVVGTRAKGATSAPGQTPSDARPVPLRRTRRMESWLLQESLRSAAMQRSSDRALPHDVG